MKQATGTCKYCGQMFALEVPDDFTQEDINTEARKKCTCPEAQALTKREENIAYSEGAIREFFKDRPDLEIIADIMLRAVTPMAECKIDKLSVSFNGYSGTMKPGKDNSIKVSLKYTTEESIEA